MHKFTLTKFKRGSSELKDKAEQCSIIVADEVSYLSNPIDELVFDKCFTHARVQLLADLSEIQLFKDD